MPSRPWLPSALRNSTHLWTRQEVFTFLFIFLILIIYSIVSVLSLQEIPHEQIEAVIEAEKQCKNLTVKKIPHWPKIIHQTWKDENVPEKYRMFQQGCRMLNPEYKYMLWTDEDLETLIREHYPWFLKTYKSYPYTIERIDSARLFIIHHHGGVYLDIDIECKVKLNVIHKHMVKANPGSGIDIVLAETDPLGITNNILIGHPNTQFLDFVTHRLIETNGVYFSPHWTVMFSAGPLFLYRSYLRYPCKQEIHLISPHDHGNVYFNHIQAKTWHNWDGPFITWFDYHGRTLLKVLALLIIVLFMAAVFRRCRRPIAETLTYTHRRWSSGDSDTCIKPTGTECPEECCKKNVPLPLAAECQVDVAGGLGFHVPPLQCHRSMFNSLDPVPRSNSPLKGSGRDKILAPRK